MYGTSYEETTLQEDREMVTNRAFAEADDTFRAACKKVGIEATRRQASKWRRKLGAAYKAKANG